MRALKGVLSVAEAVGLILDVTAVLWLLKLMSADHHHLVYIYLFPVVLIAGFYSGGLDVLSMVTALLCADYFLQEPLYSLANDNPLEYGDLFCFAVLAITAIKFIRELLRPRTSVRSRLA